MKKRILIGSICGMLLVVGIMSVYDLTQKQTVQQENTVNLNENMNRPTQIGETVLGDHADNDSKYSSGDLLYREFSSGVQLESGMDIQIERGQVINALENAVIVGVILDGNVYKEIPLEETDIEFKVEKNGNYVFMAVTADGESVDITSIVKVKITADGVILLN